MWWVCFFGYIDKERKWDRNITEQVSWTFSDFVGEKAVSSFSAHQFFFPPLTALLPSMVRRRSGHIVVISSVQGKIAIPYRSACKLSCTFYVIKHPGGVSVSLVDWKLTLVCTHCGQTQPLSTPPRPTSTAYGPRWSATGFQWPWSVLGTSGPTFLSMPSQETDRSMEVRQWNKCVTVFTIAIRQGRNIIPVIEQLSVLVDLLTPRYHRCNMFLVCAAFSFG